MVRPDSGTMGCASRRSRRYLSIYLSIFQDLSISICGHLLHKQMDRLGRELRPETSLSLSLSHTHTHTHTHALSLSLSLSLCVCVCVCVCVHLLHEQMDRPGRDLRPNGASRLRHDGVRQPQVQAVSIYLSIYLSRSIYIYMREPSS